jgi:hypothetical protein
VGIVEHRPQARRHPRRAAPRPDQAASPGASANVAGNSKNTALRRERELAVLRQRVKFDWRV